MTEGFLVFALVGFAAQVVDGALGMAYGVISSSFLLGLGVAPRVASASVHLAEVFTTGVSGVFHLKFGNVDRALFLKLAVPGAVGGILGAILLSAFPGEAARPFVAAYLVAMGFVILWKAARGFPTVRAVGKGPGPAIPIVRRGLLNTLGLAGGFFDSVGGGGWGPIVTSTLMARGGEPRRVIGSINLAEFFVTIVQAATFITLQGFSQNGPVVLGLVAGGVVAAPAAALVVRRFDPRSFMFAIGVLIVLLGFRTIWKVVV